MIKTVDLKKTFTGRGQTVYAVDEALRIIEAGRSRRGVQEVSVAQTPSDENATVEISPAPSPEQGPAERHQRAVFRLRRGTRGVLQCGNN